MPSPLSARRVATSTSFRASGSSLPGRANTSRRSSITNGRSPSLASSKQGEATIRGNLAIDFRYLGRMDEAIAQYTLAIALCREIDDRRGKCRQKHNLAHCYRRVGDLANARALAEEARDLARAMGYRRFETGATRLLADLKMREGRWAEAIEGYQETRALADDLNAVPDQMERASAYPTHSCTSGIFHAPAPPPRRRRSTTIRPAIRLFSRFAASSPCGKGSSRGATRVGDGP